VRKRLLLVAFAGLALLVASAAGAWGQQSGGITRVDTTKFPTVTINFSAPGTSKLSAEDVTVTENGRDVSDVVVTPLTESAEQVDVVLAIDTSGSMQGEPLQSAIAAARSFIDQIPPEIRVGVITFDSRPQVALAITADHGNALAAVGRLKASGETALYDGLTAAAAMFEEPGRRYIVLLSDGGDTVSTATLGSAVEVARKAGITVYAVGLQSGEFDVNALRTIAGRTGGRYQPAQTANLSSIYRGLATQITDQYLISYVSSAKPGSELDIELSAGGITDSALVLSPKARPSPVPPSPKPVEQARPLIRGSWGFILVVALTFVAAFLVLVMLLGTGARIRRDREMAARMSAALSRRPETAPVRAEGPAAWVPESMVQMAGRMAEVGGFSTTMDHRLEQAGLPLRAGEFLIFMVAGAILGGLLGFVLLQNYIFALILAVAGGTVPFVVVQVAIRRRTSRLHAQLADVLTILASSLRAGHSFMQALDTVAKEIPDPGAGEFGRVVAEIRLGRPVDEALNAMAERVGSYDFKWAVMAVNIQREVGGNLAEILDTVAETVRERDAIRRQVDVLTTEGRLSMYILTALPIAIGLYMAVVNREYISTLFTTTIGLVMFITAACLVVLGLFWMKRIVKIDV